MVSIFVMVKNALNRAKEIVTGKLVVMNEQKTVKNIPARLALSALDKMLELALVAIIGGAVIYVAIGILINESVTSWPVQDQAMWGVFILLVIIATLMIMIGIVKQKE